MTNAKKQRCYVGIDKEGTKRYYVNNVLHREDGPAVEYANGDKWWYKNGELHREEGPAIEHPNGNKFWYKNGMSHREDGPAAEFADNSKTWWLNNICYGTNNDFSSSSWISFVKTLIFS